MEDQIARQLFGVKLTVTGLDQAERLRFKRKCEDVGSSMNEAVKVFVSEVLAMSDMEFKEWVNASRK